MVQLLGLAWFWTLLAYLSGRAWLRSHFNTKTPTHNPTHTLQSGLTPSYLMPRFETKQAKLKFFDIFSSFCSHFFHCSCHTTKEKPRTFDSKSLIPTFEGKNHTATASKSHQARFFCSPLPQHLQGRRAFAPHPRYYFSFLHERFSL